MFRKLKLGSDEYEDEKLFSKKLGHHVIKRAEVMIREDALVEAGLPIGHAQLPPFQIKPIELSERAESGCSVSDEEMVFDLSLDDCNDSSQGAQPIMSERIPEVMHEDLILVVKNDIQAR